MRGNEEHESDDRSPFTSKILLHERRGTAPHHSASAPHNFFPVIRVFSLANHLLSSRYERIS